jgi:hypothetical protein
MSIAIAAVAVVLTMCAWFGLLRLRRHVSRLEARVHHLETRLATEVAPSVKAARADARNAAATARRAAEAAGVAEPPPRVPLEPVTGPMVRALALGAGARRTLGRLARPRRRS